MTRLDTGRLTPDDDLFVRMEHALRLPVVNQCVWHLDRDVDPEALADLAHRLRRGRLSRLVRRSPMPMRDSWIHTPAAGRYSFSPDVITADDTLAWMQWCAELPLDSVRGPSWRMHAARAADGGLLVSLTVAHAVGDGGAILTAIDEAVRADTVAPRVPSTPTVAARAVDDIRDAASLLRDASVAAFRIARAGRDAMPAPRTTPTTSTSSSTPATATTVADPETPGVPFIAPAHVTRVDGRAFGDAAARAGGTTNTLFTAIGLGVLEATGRVRPGAVVGVSLPMSTRGPDDRRANATSGVTARITVDDGRYHDLRPLRSASKQAFASLTESPSPRSLLAVLGQALPDRVVRRLSTTMTAPLCLTSNLGRLSPGFASLGGRRPVPVVVRAVTVGADIATIRRMAGGLSAWISESDGGHTLAFTSLDADRVADSTVLAALVQRELGRWGLAGEPWCRH